MRLKFYFSNEIKFKFVSVVYCSNNTKNKKIKIL
jgi:hypothetical protein